MNQMELYANDYFKGPRYLTEEVCSVNGAKHVYGKDQLKSTTTTKFLVMRECSCGQKIVKGVLSKI